MVDLNNTIRLVRMAVFGVASLFALLVIILGGLVTNFSNTYINGGYFTFAALGIATGLLTLLTLPAMLALSLMRKGAITSYVVVEIAWVWFLWIMWLAVGGNSASIFLIGNCGRYSGFEGSFGSLVEAACNEATAITAFGFLTWIILMFYNIVLISFAFRQHLRGYTGVWTKDVTEIDFTAPAANTPQIVYDPKAATFAPQYSQQTGTSQTVYTPSGASPYPPAQAPSPYPPAQAPSPYPQGAASPYPQV